MSMSMSMFPYDKCWQMRQELGDNPSTHKLEVCIPTPGQVMKPLFNSDGDLIDLRPCDN